MLVFLRKTGQEFVITVPGTAPIVVRVVQVYPNKARLGIEAAPSVIVHRREIQDRIDGGEERRSA